MADREKILRYFRAGGDEELAAKLLDLAEGAHRSRKFRVSDFLDPHGCNVAEIVAANFENVKLETSGGFKNAERMKVAFVAEDFFGQPDFVPFDLLLYTIHKITNARTGYHKQSHEIKSPLNFC